MKSKVIIGLVLALASSPAYASGIRSANGQSQSDWQATSEFQNFKCPEGTRNGFGVNMNFTETKSDDYYYIECNPIQVYVPLTPTLVETNTVTITPTQSTQSTPKSTTASKIDTATVATDTTTAIIDKPKSILDEELDLTWDWEKILAWIIAWFDAWWIKL